MNKSTLSNIVIFAVGAAIGSAVTWKLLKTKYEQIAQEEINSVKEEYGRLREEKEEEEEDCMVGDLDENEPVNGVPSSLAAEYAKIVNNQEYSNEKEKKEEDEAVNRPYVISPDEMYDKDYPVETLTYYADGVLTDEQDNIIEDVDEVIGLDSLNTFGQYEDDSVFVRDDEKGCDYEILRDNDKYYDKYPDESMED